MKKPNTFQISKNIDAIYVFQINGNKQNGFENNCQPVAE